MSQRLLFQRDLLLYQLVLSSSFSPSYYSTLDDVLQFTHFDKAADCVRIQTSLLDIWGAIGWRQLIGVAACTTLLLQEDGGTIRVFVPPTSLDYHPAWTTLIGSFLICSAGGRWTSYQHHTTAQAYVNFM